MAFWMIFCRIAVQEIVKIGLFNALMAIYFLRRVTRWALGSRHLENKPKVKKSNWLLSPAMFKAINEWCSVTLKHYSRVCPTCRRCAQWASILQTWLAGFLSCPKQHVAVLQKERRTEPHESLIIVDHSQAARRTLGILAAVHSISLIVLVRSWLPRSLVLSPNPLLETAQVAELVNFVFPFARRKRNHNYTSVCWGDVPIFLFHFLI